MAQKLIKKSAKTEMETARRQRIREEFQKTRAIIDARKPDLNCKMEHGDILEQMRILFLETEQRLKESESKMMCLNQFLTAKYFQGLTEGFELGKKATQFEPYLSLFMNQSNEQPSSPPLTQMQNFSQPKEVSLLPNFSQPTQSTDQIQSLLQFIQSQTLLSTSTVSQESGSDAELTFNSTGDSGVDLSHIDYS